MALCVASSRAVPSSCLSRGRPAQQRPAKAAARPGARVAFSRPRAFYGPGGGFGFSGAAAGPSPEEARRMMREFWEEVQRNGGAGFAWPGGRVWFGAGGPDAAAAGGFAGAGACDPAAAAAEGAPAARRLPVDLLREADAYVIVADVPGITKDALRIKLTAATPKAPASLLISGGPAGAGQGQQGGEAAAAAAAGEPLLRERRSGAFERRVPLPDDAASAGVTARVRDGVLMVRVPRVPQAPPRAESDIPVM